MDPAESGRAGAGVAVDAVGAVGSVLAGVALALVDVLLALCAPEAGLAGAQEAVHLVLTQAAVTAGVCGRRGHQDKLSECVLSHLLSSWFEMNVEYLKQSM